MSGHLTGGDPRVSSVLRRVLLPKLQPPESLRSADDARQVLAALRLAKVVAGDNREFRDDVEAQIRSVREEAAARWPPAFPPSPTSRESFMWRPAWMILPTLVGVIALWLARRAIERCRGRR
jgi:hypothetical protein